MDEHVLLELLLYTVAGFLAQMVDGTISMGYGVSATSLLLSFGVVFLILRSVFIIILIRWKVRVRF